MKYTHGYRRTRTWRSSRTFCLLLAAALLLGQAAPPPGHSAPAIAPASMAALREVAQVTVRLDPVADAGLDSTLPDDPLGLEPSLHLFHLGQNETGRALIRFNLAAAVPPEAIIDSAFLELYLLTGSADGPIDVTATNVLTDWLEAEVTWNTQPDTGGASTVNSLGFGSGPKVLEVTEVVQAWHNVPHYGLALTGMEEVAFYEYLFASADAAENLPVLEVTYHLPPPAEYAFSGRVYLGSPPDSGRPLEGASVELYGDWSQSLGDGPGMRLAGTTSDGTGAFRLEYLGEPFPYYQIIQSGPPGTYPTGAAAEPPGFVATSSAVTYPDLGDGNYGGIAFWDEEQPEGCPELLANGGFEEGELAPWGSDGMVDLGPGREGGSAAQFGGTDNYMGEMWQPVTIPFETAPVLLTFWWLAEAEIPQPGDALKVILQNAGEDDHMLWLPATGALGTWRYASLNLGAYAGQQVVVTFHAHTDGDVPTTFRVDDVSLSTCGGFLPDLVLTDLWPEGNRICYQIRNDGDYTAPGGHITALNRVDVEPLAEDTVDVPLSPGERWSSCFDFDWSCTGVVDSLLVWADAGRILPEWDDWNNGREEGWQCDSAPPDILSGPTVTDITAHSAVIGWETGEAGDSQVFYSRLSEGYELEEYGSSLVLSHSVLLSGLAEDTVYRFMVTSADELDNHSEGVESTFQTLPVDDGADPSVSIRDPGVWRDTVMLVADVGDDHTEKVAFCLESGAAQLLGDDDFCLVGELLFTDYSPPFELVLDTTGYENGPYTVTAQVVDSSGRSASDQVPAQFANLVDPDAPSVIITYPTPGQSVSGQVKVTAKLNDNHGLAYAYFWVNGEFGEFHPLPSNPKSTTLTFDWDTTVVTRTNTVLAVEALDTKFNKGLATVNVTVSQPAPPLSPKLKVTKHTVTRKNNAIEVSLTVSNVGQGTAKNVEVVDTLRSFQPISRTVTAPHTVDYEASYLVSPKLWYSAIDDSADLAASSSRTYTYRAIPVMVYPSPPTPAIGEAVYLTYEDTAGSQISDQVKYQVSLTTGGVSIAQAWSAALKEATYLLVTNPQRLSWYHTNTRPVDNLLSAMAELAYHKDGALGYLYVHNKYTLDNLVEPVNSWSWGWYGDNWASRLHPDFLKLLKGALLIVGESEIVPAWEESGFKVGWNPVKYSDQPYADTGGSPAPELLLGRIVGDKATTMIKPIQASIGVHTGASGYAFDQLKAVTVSGPGLGTFVQDVDDASLILHDEGYLVAKVHTKDYFKVGSFARDFEQGDAFAVGEVDVLNNDEEIVLADKSTDKVYVYDKAGTKRGEFYVGHGGSAFDDGDQIAIASNYVVVADASANRILLYDSSGIIQGSFAVTFDAGDVLAAGDVTGSSPAELLVGDHSADRVDYYSVSGTKYGGGISLPLEPQDLLAVGDVLGDAKDEVVVADRSTGKILIYSGAGILQGSRALLDVTVDGKTMTRLEWYDYDNKASKDVGGSALAIGELFPFPSGADSGKEEILIAPARNYDHLFPFWWYASKSELNGAAAIPWNFDEFEGLAIGELGNYLGRVQDEILIADRVGYVRILDTNNWLPRWHSAKPTYLPNTDVLFLSGHGNVDGCCGLSSYSGGTFPIDFNQHNPVALGTSCLTGNYQDKVDSVNFPDRLMDSGVAVYIGATQNSSGSENREAAKWLYKNWDYGESIGKAFTELERLYWKGNAKNDWWWYWAYEYNLYGDPKFAAVTSTTLTPVEVEMPGAALSIEVPSYVVTTTQGLDWVEIPGGRKLSEAGSLWLPYYSVAVDYPAGQRVQDVALVERTGLVTDTGLIIPGMPVTITACACSPEPYSGPVEDWFPQDVYDWEVFDNADGTSTLVVTVYPFYYNPLTTGVRFYQNYLFEVSAVPTEVSVTGLATDRAEYDLGEQVGINVAVENGGVVQDVIVSTLIRRAGTEETVGGLPLESLEDLQGSASLAMEWDGSSAGAGNYFVEVTLQAAVTGQVLDQETHQFSMASHTNTFVYLPLIVRDDR